MIPRNTDHSSAHEPEWHSTHRHNPSKLSGLRIAVTGARGFIGSRLVTRLSAMGLTPEVLSGDVRAQETFAQPFDVLFHLAGSVPADFVNEAPAARASNEEGTANAAEACQRQDAALVYASSSGVYALPSDEPLPETADISPGSEYAESKLAGEYMCRMAATGLSRGVTVLRLFNPYGFGQSEKLLIGYITACLHSGKPARIRTPDAQRDFVHVSDVIDALILGAEGGRGFRVYNIGSGRAAKVGQVADHLLARADGSNRIGYGDGIDLLGPVVADISLARKELGWEPQVELQTGLDEAVGLIPVIG